MQNEYRSILLHYIDLLFADLEELRSSGPHFRIYHRFCKPGTVCAPGEEILAVCLVHRGREYCLPLSLALRILFDYLANHARLPQSAAQIEAGIRANPFYTEHAASIKGKKGLRRRISRSAVKVYIQRLRLALWRAFEDAGLQMDARAVLVSQDTVMNDVGYRLKGTVKWVHIVGGIDDIIDSSLTKNREGGYLEEKVAITISHNLPMFEDSKPDMPHQESSEDSNHIPGWVKAKRVNVEDGEGHEYSDIAVELAPKPPVHGVNLSEVLGNKSEDVEAKAEEVMKALDSLYDYFLRASNVWMQDDGKQRFPHPVNWYDAAARATMAGIVSAREIIHVAAAYKDGDAPYTDAGDMLSGSQANANAQAAFSRVWKEMGLAPLLAEPHPGILAEPHPGMSQSEETL
jgi:hypothetical protein